MRIARASSASILVGLTASLVLASPSTAAAGPDAEQKVESGAGRSVQATWWEKEGGRIRYHSLSVVELPPDSEDPLIRYRGSLDILECEARYHECDYADEVHRRLKVVSFEMDPLVMSARAVVELDGRRGDLTWTGTGEPGDPVGSSNYESIDVNRAYVDGSASVSRSREASAEGRVFGSRLAPGEINYAWMSESGYADAWACASLETCDGIR